MYIYNINIGERIVQRKKDTENMKERKRYGEYIKMTEHRSFRRRE